MASSMNFSKFISACLTVGCISSALEYVFVLVLVLVVVVPVLCVVVLCVVAVAVVDVVVVSVVFVVLTTCGKVPDEM